MLQKIVLSAIIALSLAGTSSKVGEPVGEKHIKDTASIQTYSDPGGGGFVKQNLSSSDVALVGTNNIQPYRVDPGGGGF